MRANADDADPLGAAWLAHAAHLLRFATLMVGDPTVAEDLVADAFARTFSGWSRRRIDSLPSYLRRAIVNGCHDRWRRGGRERHFATETWRSITPPDDDCYPETVAVRGRLVVHPLGPPPPDIEQPPMTAWDPATDSWQRLPSPDLERRCNSAFVASDDALLMWGGHTCTGFGGDGLADGALLTFE